MPCSYESLVGEMVIGKSLTSGYLTNFLRPAPASLTNSFSGNVALSNSNEPKCSAKKNPPTWMKPAKNDKCLDRSNAPLPSMFFWPPNAAPVEDAAGLVWLRHLEATSWNQEVPKKRQCAIISEMNNRKKMKNKNGQKLFFSLKLIQVDQKWRKMDCQIFCS